MATGDAAAAKGLRVVPATKDINQGYDDINKRGDELAAEIDARTVADADEASARAVAVALKLDASKLLVTATPMTAGTAVGTIRVW